MLRWGEKPEKGQARGHEEREGRRREHEGHSICDMADLHDERLRVLAFCLVFFVTTGFLLPEFSELQACRGF
jgi:hypothetical protein